MKRFQIAKKKNFLLVFNHLIQDPLRYDVEKLPIDDPVLKDAVNYWSISRMQKLLKMIF